MYKVGDKFEIEIDEVIKTDSGKLYAIKGFSALVFDKYGLSKLKPIKEPEKPEVDWSTVAVDTLIRVRDYKTEEYNLRHFARYVDGKVYAWRSGKTSKTAFYENDVCKWHYAEIVE